MYCVGLCHVQAEQLNPGTWKENALYIGKVNSDRNHRILYTAD